MEILPKNFDKYLNSAIKRFWNSRTIITNVSQEGGRGSVIAGKNMDGFSELIKIIASYCGISEEDICINCKSRLTIPGYFRPTKMWDSVVIYKGRLIAAFELKSQVGSFGNNFNNRSEESIGSANDFWVAFREKAFELNNSTKWSNLYEEGNAIKPPFLGYLMLLEESPLSTTPVKVEEHHFKVFPEFYGASYAKRYQILCERLVKEGLYSSACLILSPREEGKIKGAFNSPSLELSPKSLFSDFASKLLAAKQLY